MTSQELYPELYTIRFYLKQSLKMLVRHPGIISLADLTGNFKKWKYAGYDGIFDNPSPWMADSAVRFLKKITHKNAVIFEYGSGSSSLFFAQRAANVISVEHNPEWHASVCKEIQSRGLTNVSVHLQTAEERKPGSSENPDISDPLAYASVFEAYKNVRFQSYAAFIEGWPQESFDIVIVDGRARPSCLFHAWDRVKKGGFLVLDNSDRPHYKNEFSRICQLASGKWQFFGPVAQNPVFQETTFWRK